LTPPPFSPINEKQTSKCTTWDKLFLMSSQGNDLSEEGLIESWLADRNKSYHNKKWTATFRKFKDKFKSSPNWS
jgi:hypothetical protein